MHSKRVKMIWYLALTAAASSMFLEGSELDARVAGEYA